MKTNTENPPEAEDDLQPNLKAIKRALSERFEDAGRDRVMLQSCPLKGFHSRIKYFGPCEINGAAQWACEENLGPANVYVSLPSASQIPVKRNGNSFGKATLHCAHLDLRLPPWKISKHECDMWTTKAWASFTARLPDDVPDGFEIIDSGNEFTLIWPFTEALPATPDNYVRVGSINQGLAAALRAYCPVKGALDRDSAVGIVGSFLHLAGTIRWPHSPWELQRGSAPALIVLERAAKKAFRLRAFA